MSFAFVKRLARKLHSYREYAYRYHYRIPCALGRLRRETRHEYVLGKDHNGQPAVVRTDKRLAVLLTIMSMAVVLASGVALAVTSSGTKGNDVVTVPRKTT